MKNNTLTELIFVFIIEAISIKYINIFRKTSIKNTRQTNLSIDNTQFRLFLKTLEKKRLSHTRFNAIVHRFGHDGKTHFFASPVTSSRFVTMRALFYSFTRCYTRVRFFPQRVPAGDFASTSSLRRTERRQKCFFSATAGSADGWLVYVTINYYYDNDYSRGRSSVFLSSVEHATVIFPLRGPFDRERTRNTLARRRRRRRYINFLFR